MSLCFHPVECHAIHASCTIKGLVTNYTVIFVDYAKHRPECRDTSGTFTELPALNLKAHQGVVRRLIRKNGRKGQEGVAFCPIARKLAYITY